MARILGAGQMRKRVQIQQVTDAPPNSFNEVGPRPATVLTAWAFFEPIAGREVWYGVQVQAEVTHGVRTRYFPSVHPTARYQLVMQGRTFQVVYLWDLEERHHWLLWQVKEWPMAGA